MFGHWKERLQSGGLGLYRGGDDGGSGGGGGSDTESVSIDRADNSNVSVSSYGGMDTGVSSRGSWGKDDSGGGYDRGLSEQASRSTRSPSANRSGEGASSGASWNKPTAPAKPEKVEIEKVDPSKGAKSYGAPMPSFDRQPDGSMRIGTDLSGIDRDGYRAWADNPSMARNYRTEARAVRDSVRRGVAINEPNGLLSKAMGLWNPAAGLATEAVINAKQASDFAKDAWGEDLSLMDHVADAAVTTLPSKAGGYLGQQIGGRLGATVGPYGLVAGALLGGAFGKNAVNEAITSGMPASGGGTPTPGDGSGNQVDLNRQIAQGGAAPTGPQMNAPQGVATGWDSKFGGYDSHLDNFKGGRGVGRWA